MLPTKERITQEYGMTSYARAGAYGGLPHSGIDFGISYLRYWCPSITATCDFAGWDNSGFGNLIILKDQYGFRHWFAHNSAFLMSKGQGVTIRTPIAVSGNSGMSSGPHLHWGVQLPGFTGYNGFINPRNWPGFNDQPGGEDMALAKANDANKLQAIKWYIYAITEVAHSDSDIRKNHFGTEAEFSEYERKVLADKFYASEEYAAQGLRAYKDRYDKNPSDALIRQWKGEVAKKAAARVSIPNLRKELMQN